MKMKNVFLILFMGLISIGCDHEFKGKVVDAETGKPIEGAVVLVEWLTIKGLPGLTHTESVKVIEAVTDKEGEFTIIGALKQAPHVTVYKKGYVAWNNNYIFPDYKKRTGAKLKNGFIFNLEKFRKEYSYDKHVSFIHRAINWTLNDDNKKMISKAFDWEETLAYKERRVEKQSGGLKK